jgi:hypothetical protein
MFSTMFSTEGFLYPNPSSNAAHGSDDIILFEFLGRILGMLPCQSAAMLFCIHPSQV